MNTKPIPGIAILDIIIFTTIFWMILKKGSKRTNPVADVAAAAATGAGGGHHRGNWAPGWAYLPVMLIRWAIVPHKDWMCEHRHRQEVMDSQLHEDHRHHYHHHHQQHHRNHPHSNDHGGHRESYCADSKQPQNVNIMDCLFGQ
mmetsp:Transcript_3588/g.6779  ORF Transcript_3588/g.6779 Transcript_3588/m.6779 type:complete len:144 (+) Transcript_3588:110-541(+)